MVHVHACLPGHLISIVTLPHSLPLVIQSQLIRMRQRWARGPTPPVPDDEDDDGITPHHHGDNHSQHQNGDDPSHQHHHGDSPTHQSNLNETTPCPPSHVPASHSESEEGEERDRERGQAGDELEQEDRDEGGLDLDSLLMREEDIVREKEQRLRKRAREGGASEDAGSPGDTNSSEKREERGLCEDGRKRLKHSWEDDLDELLSEEDNLLSEMASYNTTTS